MSTLQQPPGEMESSQHVAFACLLIASGGLLLGLQWDASGDLHGTCLSALGTGAFVALAAAGLQARGGGLWLPRDTIALAAAAFSFAAVAFAVSAVLVPSGPWLFAEVLILIALLARGRPLRSAAGPGVTPLGMLVLALMLCFRLWITYRASIGRSEVAAIDVPLVSSLPFAFLEPLKTIEIGVFALEELCLPADGPGADFGLTTATWALGFALCCGGLLWLERAAPEHENDRVHATIRELPPALADLVEKVLPEDEWQTLGLHGLPDRLRRKRIETLFRERVRNGREIQLALERSRWLAATNPGGFAGELMSAIEASDSSGPARDAGVR